MNKFIKSTFIAFLMIVFVPVMVLAEESRIVENENISVTDTDELSMVSNFVNYIGMNDVNYSNWLNASVAYGYNLYNCNMDKKIAKLYYVKHNGENVGYVIIDIVDYKILEYSVLTPAYDMVNVDGDKVYLYVNGMPLIYANNTYYELSISGKIISSKNNTSLYYYPNIQSGNCIVGAISNLIWHYGKNGYDSLISGMNFSEVEKSVDTIINNEGGYVNNNIPNTIRRYVSSKTSKYSVSVTNKWNPTFYNVQVEVSTRPCLLGFAAGSPYSDSVGHMTVCVGTRLYNNWGYVQVMDGWSTGVVEKAWGSYNDFMSLVLFSN